MDPSNLSYPDGYRAPDDLSTFRAWVWHNPELCNNCFSHIRHVGEEVAIETRAWTLHVNAYYERTERGSQEYAPWSPPASERFGTCFCLNCGSDTQAENHTLPVDRMTRRAKRLVRYIVEQTPLTIDGETVGRTIRDLKAVHDNGGYDSEIFAVAFTYAVRDVPGQGRRKAAAKA